MNRHFDDAWYHAKRTGANVAEGIRMELNRVGRRAEQVAGREPERTRFDEMRDEVRRAERRVERAARRTADRARGRFRTD